MSDPGVASLLCRITPDALGALPLTHVKEIMRPLPVFSAVGASTPIQGLATIRGVPTPVVDAAALMGSHEPATRYVTITSGTRQVALAVADVIGLIHLRNDDRAGASPLFDARVQACASVDERLPGVLLSMRRVSDSEWRRLQPGVETR